MMIHCALVISVLPYMYYIKDENKIEDFIYNFP